jgi:hypothetical protein
VKFAKGLGEFCCNSTLLAVFFSILKKAIFNLYPLISPVPVCANGPPIVVPSKVIINGNTPESF